ncbi:MAG TPA: glycerophosphodiester phosphodiesterase family protein, partial [Spirochaetota bacterium]|nr:glycerophosphodiester phosphodiesterase family protein [Spirochaetota bacterium]HPJ37734.1 glycerophosphodiester phosphodiesterase family protein [Spirochaetota bacterium]HPQ51716.1 glycerophosphodiester phosphodiesterase family protein [Spirochaetota bacterium]
MDKKFLKIAHRGYSELYSENTLPAFQKAIEYGADMIELDVHLTKDGVPVVIHDNDIERTSNGKGDVSRFSLKELRQFDVDFKKTSGDSFVPIPTLEEVIDLVKGKIQLNIEIKNCPHRYKGIEEAVASLLTAKEFIPDTIVSSFDHFCLLTIKKIEPEIKTGMLYDSVWITFQEEVRALDIFSLHPSIDAFDLEQARWAKQSGYRVYPWVARSRETVAWIAESGLADGVMVNDLAFFTG